MERRHNEEQARERDRTLAQLHEVEQQDLVLSGESFDCPICFMEIDAGEGVMLRDCLHLFCRDCLAGYILHNEESCIVCPYKDTYTCNVPLQEREIKALVTAEVFGKYLQRGLTQAEGAMKNTFHCKTADCRGWCEYEDEVNFFPCPVCKQTNCLTCKAIHMGKNCKEYQDELKAEAAHNENAQKDKQAIEQMLRSGDAMNCPGCGVILQKKEGCDWLKCSMCRTEICWVTRGPRWGPGGTGDTSGGCKCRVNGQPCHPKCGNCH